jgi:hypothetical protein
MAWKNPRDLNADKKPGQRATVAVAETLPPRNTAVTKRLPPHFL